MGNLIRKGKFVEIDAVRWTYSLKYLKEGKIVFYLDVDIVVLKNPLDFVDWSADLNIQNDNGKMCIGCMMFLPNSRTISIVESMATMAIPTTKWDNYQVLFNQIADISFRYLIKIHVLPVNQFPNGQVYFLDKKLEARKDPVLIHANCMVGIDVKKKALKEAKLWFLSAE
jgi:hypothetical protein